MEPTLLNGAIVLCSSIPYFFVSPRVGDIVIVKDNETEKIIIKRVEKKEGERYFLIGDNIKDSLDSKKLGWFERKDIIGKVIF